MTIEEYTAEVRAVALAMGAIAHDGYWSPNVWRGHFENGFTPADAWEEEQQAALRAL